jgi:hypothetical protein
MFEEDTWVCMVPVVEPVFEMDFVERYESSSSEICNLVAHVLPLDLSIQK